ncbi:protein kinase [Streptomyces sp. p1417]|uniref:non-specific serine/threonine protein kinase n=1 Tax=Streptomyces typhae TaxID=2681492 RepID=A0A6L6XAE9_9ACTN|nr:serine/threonine-protein kinase [Streptomyces typhae]MVO90776.1 protein kinase [Streptomyces typhae]
MTIGRTRRIADRYELSALPMPGGMGLVCEGYDIVLDRPVAIKQIRVEKARTPAELAVLVGRFRREARVTARIEHPGVPAVYDAAIDQSAESPDDAAELYVVMQLIRGMDLRDLVAEQGPLPVEWAVAVAAQICSVLSYAHAVPVVHRDLKPSNIMIDGSGAVKVLDFGVASVFGADTAQLTETGRPVGTRDYMAPEQFLGVGVSPRSDLYGLGCVLHEMLAGRKVLCGTGDAALRHVHGSPEPLRSLRPDVPVELERLVLDLLEKNPDDRPADAHAVHDRLVPHLPSPGTAPRGPSGLADPTRPYRAPLAPKSRLGLRTEPGPARPAPPALSDALVQEGEEKAVRLFEEGRFTQAAHVLDELLDQADPLDPRLAETRRIHAGVLLAGEDFRRALGAFKYLAAEAKNGRDLREYRQHIALCLATLGEHEQALEEYRSLLPEAPDTETIVLRQKIADLLLALHRADEAADLLRSLVSELPPEHPSAVRSRELLKRIQLAGGATG